MRSIAETIVRADECRRLAKACKDRQQQDFYQLLETSYRQIIAAKQWLSDTERPGRSSTTRS